MDIPSATLVSEAPRPTAPLDRERIASVALTILDQHGVSGFSMRAVARALGVTPMALYHHVQDKAALAALVIETASKEQPLGPPVDPWQANLRSIAAWMRQSAITHPALQELRRMFRVWTPFFHELADRWMSSWQRSGLDSERAVLAAMTSSAAIWGLVVDELQIRNQKAPPVGVDLPALPNADLLLSTMGDADEMFDLGVQAIIEGLHARLLRDQNS